MASIAYWIIGIFVVGMVTGLVNHTFTPRSESSFPKYMTYQELLQAEAELIISVPTQLNAFPNTSSITDIEEVLDSVEAAATNVEIVYSFSEIPSDMEGPISDLFAALGATPAEVLEEGFQDILLDASDSPDINQDIPDWVFDAEIEASEDAYPIEATEAADDPNETGITPTLEHDLVGLEPPVSEMDVPVGYEEIAFRVEELQDSGALPNALSRSNNRSNVIPFPGAKDFLNIPDQAPYHIPITDYAHIRLLYGHLADRVTTTPALGPRFAEDVMIGAVMEEYGNVFLEFRGSKIPISKNAKPFKGETILVTGQFVSEQKFLASRILLAQEAAKARQAISG